MSLPSYSLLSFLWSSVIDHSDESETIKRDWYRVLLSECINCQKPVIKVDKTSLKLEFKYMYRSDKRTNVLKLLYYLLYGMKRIFNTFMSHI